MSSYGFKSLQVFTTCDGEFIKTVADKATELNLQHSGAVYLPLNGNWFLTVYPNGSKLGWPEARQHDEKLYELISMCAKRNHEQGDRYMHFVLVDSFQHEQLGEWQHRLELAI